jgi:glutathione S-transferase
MNQHRIESFGLPVSNFTRAVRIVCEEKSIAYHLRPVPPHSLEAMALHPLGKIPGLRHGDVTLGESRAIVAYLDRLFPETPLVPTAPLALAVEVEQWVSIITTAVDPVLVRQYVLAYLSPDTSDGAIDRKAVDSALPKLEALIGILDKAVAETGFLAAGRFTFADALLLPILAAVRLFPEGGRAIEGAPNLAGYFKLHSARPSFTATDPWT